MLVARRLAQPVLRVPLFVKLVGANAIIIVIAALALWGPAARIEPGTQGYAYLAATALCAGTLMNVWLVRLALKPIRELQRVARSVAEGAMSERASQSPLADPELARLIDTTNQMLDRLAADRARMRKLGAEVVYAQEEERAQVAHDLHDSVAQTLTAASFQLTGMLAGVPSPSEAAKLGAIRELIGLALEEIRGVSQSLHPRVAADLGLPSALESLARMTRERSLIDVIVISDLDRAGIPSVLVATLYRVAREALRHVEQHADAGRAIISLLARNGAIELSVADDGAAFDESRGRLVTHSAGMKSAQKRLSLAGGEMHIDRAPNGGTRVVARISTGKQVA